MPGVMVFLLRLDIIIISSVMSMRRRGQMAAKIGYLMP
nr:MAG TPA: hypothetical protein [Caudoviricetes sp.]